MGNNLSQYDAFQAIRAVYDKDKNCLRVCIVDGGTGGGGPIEVIIDHTTDSIRLGDGTSLVTTTTDGSKVGLDVNILNSPTVTTPLITNIIYGTINTEDSHAFQSETKRFMIRFRGRARMNLAFNSGATGTTYLTLHPGTIYTEDDIKNPGSLTIYFRANKAGVIEIIEWS